MRGEVARQPGIGIDAIGKRITRRAIASDRIDITILVWLNVGGTKALRNAQVGGAEALIDTLQVR